MLDFDHGGRYADSRYVFIKTCTTEGDTYSAY